MKYILSFFLTLSVLCTSLSAVEYGFLYSFEEEASLTLNAGDKLEILMYDGYNDVSSIPQYWNYLRAYNLDDKLLNSYSLGASHALGGPTYYGPLKIVLYSGTNFQEEREEYFTTVQYRLTRASEVEYKNINIVALPSSTVGQGTHEIVVEASDDLQTWTPVHSSSIGGDKAFFRTRVVEAGD